MAATLDLRSPEINIKFDKGKTLDPIFYYLSDKNEVINLTGFTARMQARLTTDTAVLAGFDLTTQNGGLEIITGTFTPPKGTVVVANAQGVKLNVADTVTAAIDWAKALYDIELISPSGKVIPFLKGQLLPTNEITK